MQELSMFDFEKKSRFKGLLRFDQFEGSGHLLSDNFMQVALLTELMHRGADANQVDELVSFVCKLWLVAFQHGKVCP